MRKLFRNLVFAAAALVVSFSIVPAPAHAASCSTAQGTRPLFCYNGPKILDDDGGTSTVREIMKLLFGILGAVSIIVIIYAAMRLTLSRGNPDAISKLRNTIIYAGIGLAVAVSATAILQFVIKGVS